ncbi:Lrp/AsnC family transcriptional regulator [Sphingosinicella microcystinivorans]|uniref:AsnC family transcriptional regulator n=1 Tax=Sphingosinicella microcystinivorans TaxID=335406 RepID=A0AAD1D8Z1_SPHMI|nr:Lrp/AsnC family transcriptional regulator [Sphingosinicella microcystinivorans]RKS86342.1 AsnC family transcriptional regulator [Sphingosinicella microcystinivorans]BBE35613.1 AsnC family transcriptional regulator [Sphingosinicella microcystinivorans]
MTKTLSLDAVDYRLLEALQANARASAEELSEIARLSAPACYRRIQRLRAGGAIERVVAIVAPKTMGWPLVMIVLVALERERREIIDGFIRKLAAVPEIVEAWYVTGDHDFALRVLARDMESFEEMTRRVLYGDENVKSFKTLVTMRQVKKASPVRLADDLAVD